MSKQYEAGDKVRILVAKGDFHRYDWGLGMPTARGATGTVVRHTSLNSAVRVRLASPENGLIGEFNYAPVELQPLEPSHPGSLYEAVQVGDTLVQSYESLDAENVSLSKQIHRLEEQAALAEAEAQRLRDKIADKMSFYETNKDKIRAWRTLLD